MCSQRARLDADGVGDAAHELHMRAVQLPSALAAPQHVPRAVVPARTVITQSCDACASVARQAPTILQRMAAHGRLWSKLLQVKILQPSWTPAAVAVIIFMESCSTFDISQKTIQRHEWMGQDVRFHFSL